MNQWLTIAKVSGRSGDAVLQKVRSWANATEADPACRLEIEQFAAQLRANAALPPVVYYCEYIDSWSAGDLQCRWMESETLKIIRVCGDPVELTCCPLDDATTVIRHCKHHLKTMRKTASPEDRWFVRKVLEAALVWESLGGALVIVRRVTGGTVTDEEVERAGRVVANWL